MFPAFQFERHFHRISIPTEIELEDLAKRYRVFPLRLITNGHREELLLAMSNPYDLEAIAMVEFRSGISVRPVLANLKDILSLIHWLYEGGEVPRNPSREKAEVFHSTFEQFSYVSEIK